MPIKGQKLEDVLKKQLDIKYSAVSSLIKEAKLNLEFDPKEVLDEGRELEVLDEAIIIYEDDLTDEERAEMKAQKVDSNAEPEWKKKARLAAEKRERQWAEEEKREKEEEARRLQAARNSRKERKSASKPKPAEPVTEEVVVETVEEQQSAAIVEETVAKKGGTTIYTTTDEDGVTVKRTVTKRVVKGKKPKPKPQGEVSTCYCIIL